MMINNVLVVENKNAGATLSEIHVYLERQLDGKWKVVNRTSENLQIKEYEPDPELTALLASYDTRAKEDAVTPIGELKGGDLAPETRSTACRRPWCRIPRCWTSSTKCRCTTPVRRSLLPP